MIQKELVCPDKIHYFNSVSDTDRKWVSEWLLQITDVPTEDEPRTPEFEAQLTAMKAVLCRFSEKELGVDVSHRLLGNERIHVLSPENFALVEQPKSKSTTDGFHLLYSDEIVVVKKLYPETTLVAINHELVHTISRVTATVEAHQGNRYYNPVHSGYQNLNNGVFRALDEGLTQKICFETIDRYWEHDPVLKNLNVGYCAKIAAYHYSAAVVFLNGVARSIAAKNHITRLEAYHMLERGKILGDMQALRAVTDVIGIDGMKRLAVWRPYIRETIKIAKALQLADTVDKLHELHKIQKSNPKRKA